MFSSLIQTSSSVVVDILQKTILAPEFVGVTSAVTFSVCNLYFVRALRFYQDPVHFTLKLIDMGARVVFKKSGMFTSNPKETFDKQKYELLAGYEMKKKRLDESARGFTDVPVGTLQRDEVLIPSYLNDGHEIKVRLFYVKRDEADTSPLPLMLYFHGGGYVISHIDSAEYDTVCSDFARNGFIVASVEYRLAPEHEWPTPLHDGYSALLWCQADPQSMPSRNHPLLQHADASRLVVSGDSAGGNLSVVMSHLCKDKLNSHLRPAAPCTHYPLNNPHIDKLALIYPSCGCRSQFRSGPYFRDHGYILSGQLIDAFHELYKPKNIPYEDWLADTRVSPLLHADLTGLPKTALLLAELDQLRDEGAEYHRRLVAAGVKSTLIEIKNTVHGFWGVDFLPEYPTAMKQLVEAVKAL